MALMTGARQNLTPKAKALDLVICVDRSRSMGYGHKQTKLNEAKHLAFELTRSLSPDDRVAIVTFDSIANIHLPLTAVSQLKNFEATLDQISERGNTCLIRGLKASREAFNLEAARNRRLIILSDGRTNLPFGGHGGFEGSASLERELKEEYTSLEQAGIETIAIAIGTDAFIMPLKTITDAMRGRLILDGLGNIQRLAGAIHSDAMSLPLAVKTPLLEKRGLEVAAMPSEFPTGPTTWSLESLNEHVAVVSEEIASACPTIGVLVSNPSNQRFARVALASIEDDTLKSYHEHLPKTAEKVRSGETILLDKSYRLELELDKDDVVDLKT